MNHKCQVCSGNSDKKYLCPKCDNEIYDDAVKCSMGRCCNQEKLIKLKKLDLIVEMADNLYHQTNMVNHSLVDEQMNQILNSALTKYRIAREKISRSFA